MRRGKFKTENSIRLFNSIKRYNDPRSPLTLLIYFIYRATLAVSAKAETVSRGPQVMSEGGRSQTNTVLGTFIY